MSKNLERFEEEYGRYMAEKKGNTPGENLSIDMHDLALHFVQWAEANLIFNLSYVKQTWYNEGYANAKKEIKLDEKELIKKGYEKYPEKLVSGSFMDLEDANSERRAGYIEGLRDGIK